MDIETLLNSLQTSGLPANLPSNMQLPPQALAMLQGLAPSGMGTQLGANLGSAAMPAMGNPLSGLIRR